MNDESPSSSRSFAPSLRASEKRPRKGDEWLARGLGGLSLGLAGWHLLMPGRVAKRLGLPSTPRVRTAMLGFGLRELISGVGILKGRRRAPWLWMRVGGDLMDLALLATMTTGKRRMPRELIGPAVGIVTGALVLDAFAAARASKTTLQGTASITINRPPEEVYAFWRRFENLPTFMENIASVDVIDEERSHWAIRGPAGMALEWEAELIQDHENRLIAWRSTDDADVTNAGAVRFRPAPGDRGTEVRVDIRWEAPAGRFGRALARLFGREPAQQAKADLRRLKQVLETGSVVHSDASLHGRLHPARPSRSRQRPQDRRRETNQDNGQPPYPNGRPVATQKPAEWESVQ